MAEDPSLKRVVGTSLLVLYGVGTIIGAGIYALLGEVSARAGYWTPASFVLAAAMAAATALSFAELSSRFPKSAGEAEYVAVAFGSQTLSTLVGLLVILIGTISAATVANGFAGYAGEVLAVPKHLLIAGFMTGVGLIAAWGIQQSLWVAAGITIAEIAGLILVIGFASFAVLTGAAPEPTESNPAVSFHAAGILSGAILAFYAYVGFEDMVNVAEEVRDAPRTLPIAIVVTLTTTTAIYLVLSLLALRIVPPTELANSAAPLRLVYERAGGPQPRILNAVGVVAMLNGALVQIIMAARVTYGLTQRNALPAWIGSIHPTTRTPIRATAAITAIALLIALMFPIATLAEATSVITLGVFGCVNLALIRIKKRRDLPQSRFNLPNAVPWWGLVISIAGLAYGLIAKI